jgi:hypothetical protein
VTWGRQKEVLEAERLELLAKLAGLRALRRRMEKTK